MKSFNLPLLSKLLVVVVLLSMQNIYAQLQTKNWIIKEKSKGITYSPRNGDKFFYVIFNPEVINSNKKKDWLVKMTKRIEKSYTSPLKWKLNQEKNNEWSCMASAIYKSKKFSVLLKTETLSDDSSFIVYMGGDPLLLLKHYKSYANVIDDAKKRFQKKLIVSNKIHQQNHKKKVTYKKKTKLTHKQKKLAIERAIRTASGKGAKPSNIAAVMIDSGLDVLVGGFYNDTYILFKDGTAYVNCKIPPNELLVSKSKELQPEKWTKWRKSGAGYQIFNKKKGIWKKLDAIKAIKVRNGERLNNKYISAGGSQMYGSHRSWITFKPNGRFELKNISMMSSPSGSIGPSTTTVHKSDKSGTTGTTVVSGTNVGGGATSKKKDGSKNTGTYHLNGYTITLKHDNGYEHTELFFFYKANKKTFIYRDERFWVDKK